MIVTLVRTVIIYIFVTVGIRLMGKRQIGEMQPNELVITIIISEIAAIPIADINAPILNAVISVGMLIILEIVLSIITMKSNLARRVVNGKFAVIIKDGVIDQRKMRNLRLTIDDLLEELRQKDIFNLSDVQYAIVENNGKLSVMLRPEVQPATAVQGTVENTGLPVMVINDGVLDKNAVQDFGIDKREINKVLKNKKLDISEVFVMTLDKQNNNITVKKEL